MSRNPPLNKELLVSNAIPRPSVTGGYVTLTESLQAFATNSYSSGVPKIAYAERPLTLRVASTHSSNRGPAQDGSE
jgi:hypothetical protein